ncbi:MAG: histidinol dehydrogenase [Candidatus Latescibacterota bacterium]|nr:histidinol dehydrogenase [Candidatus Latescibacterota bacterium]
MEIVAYPSEPLADKIESILRRRIGVSDKVDEAVRQVLHQVRVRRDQAVVEYTERFDGVSMGDSGYRMSPAALQAGLDGLDASLRSAMEAAVANIRSFHEHQRDKSWFVEDGDGVLLGKKVTPIDRLGVCVPAGEVPLFSSLLMCAIPAQIAGVGEICVVSPPQQDGQVHPVIAAAARLIGIDEVHAVGGAQAVGAMAYGTETVAPVDKIVGPGSPYTVAAQKQVFGLVGIPMLPGPSEIVVLADGDANPAYIAADLLSQAEHGWGVASVCITDSRVLAEAVSAEVERQMETLPRADAVRAALEEYGAIAVVDSLDSGFELLNRIAPEHAELLVADPWKWLDQVRHCGAVFLGEAASEPVGDYFAGTNHVLPTNGAARYASSLGVGDFVKTTSVIAYTETRLRTTQATIARLARAESLEAHARAVEVRCEEESS